MEKINADRLQTTDLKNVGNFFKDARTITLIHDIRPGLEGGGEGGGGGKEDSDSTVIMT